MFNNMVCSWCEEDNELITLCNFDNHNVCKLCYEKYRETYPLRVEGCPYCKGNQERVMVRVHIPDEEVDSDSDGDGVFDYAPHDPETIFPASTDPQPQEIACDNGIISIIISSAVCMIFIVFCFSRAFMVV